MLLIVLGILCGGFLLFTNGVVNGVYNLEVQAARMKAISSSVAGIQELNTYVENRELEKFVKKLSLAALAAKGLIKNNWDGKSVDYNDGSILNVEDGKIEFPESIPPEYEFDQSKLVGNEGLFSVDLGKLLDTGEEDTYLVGYNKIGDSIYYMEGELLSELEERAKINFDAESRLKAIEEAFGFKVLFASEEADADGNHPLLYKADDLPETFTTAEACGITKEMLENAPTSSRSLSAEKLMESVGRVEYKNQSWITFVQAAKGSDILNENVYLVYLIPEEEFISMTMQQTVVILAAFLVVGIILLVWFYSLIRLVRHYRLNEEQAEHLGTRRTVRKAFSMIVIGCLVIFFVSALLLSLLRLFGICNSVKKSLSVLEQRVEDSKLEEKTTLKERKASYVTYAENLAAILKERPELATKENLQTFSDLIEADYIMIYDPDGKEVLSNSQYVNMELGKTPESSTYEFRRLLKGIPSVVHDVQTDEETGLKNALIGVCLESPEDAGKYGALLVAVPEDKLRPEKLETLDDVMKSLVTAGTLSFSVDPESQVIKNSSNSEMIGKNAVSLELPQTALIDSYRDFFTFNNTACYGESTDIDGTLYYYAAEQPHIYKNILVYAGLASLACFVFLTVLIGYLMFGYKKAFAYWSKEGEELEEAAEERKRFEEDQAAQEDPRKRWKLSLSRFGLRTPMHNASVTLEILMVGAIVGVMVWYYFKGANTTGSLLGFVIHGQWTKGFNLFSFTSILILFAQVLITVTILKVLVRIVSSTMGPKGDTFCRLALNLITYAGMIFFVYMALYNVGINLGALIASLSLPAFALSLGAKDLITDIVAGISIVFDGEFRVGDIVDIGGFSGKVLEIGVRTTKLLGANNNIKIIANRDVKNVINKSKNLSVFSLDVTVSMSDYKLKEVEDMLRTQLPKLREQVPEITGEPVYRGVKAIGGGNATLTISVECEEMDIDKVTRAMNHAIQDLFDEQGVKFK